MNGMPYTSDFIGAMGRYPIYEYINQIDSNSSNFTTTTSNILEQDLLNTGNILQTQITNTCNLVYKDGNQNTVVRSTAQNPFYPVGNSVDIRFQNVNGDCLTKIIQTGELMVYHPLTPLPVGYTAGWWNVENKIAGLLTDTIGLRFDVTNLQLEAGTNAITDSVLATGAVSASAGALAGLGASTAVSGGMIASGNIGTASLAVAGASLIGVLGYLSYQAQIMSNLSSNGFFTQASQVQSNINLANILVTDNISNICIAKGFINCNIKTPQYISKINSDSIVYKNNELSTIFNSATLQEGGTNLSSKYLTLSGGTLTGKLSVNPSAYGAPSVGVTGGSGDKLILYSGSVSTYPYSLGINAGNMFFSIPVSSTYSWYVNGSILMNLSTTGLLSSSTINATTSLQQNGINLNTFITNTSNYASNINDNLLNYVNVNNLNTSNYIKNNNTNLSNLCLNLNINTSNFVYKQNIILPYSNFWYDAVRGLYCYDLNIEKYVKSIDLGGGYRYRRFRISTYVDKADWRTKWNLLYNNQYVNDPETLTIIQNNNSNVGGNSYPNDAYCNGIILGKTRETNISYWNINLQNFNYIRYVTYLGWDTNICIENLT